jgi:hypothetical protein
MSNDKKVIYTSGGGIGLGTTLFIVFLVLKLCGVIDWSWWWVFLPLIAPYILGTAVLLIIFGILYVSHKILEYNANRYYQ